MLKKEELEAAFDERFPQDIKIKLHSAHVAIAGLGGLGSNIAVMLARSGVGHLLLVDFDTVVVSNLNRQMYELSHLGKKKTEALKELLAAINPYLDVEVQCVKVTKELVPKLFASYPIVCEAFDSAEAKTMLIETLLTECPKTTIVAGNGIAGYGDANEIRTEQKLRRLYVCGDQKTDIADGIGLMAPRVAICAGHQANKVIQLILEK